MITLGKTALIASGLLLATAISASAGGNGGGGVSPGAAFGWGVFGGVVGSALAPAPQAQPVIIIQQPPPVIIQQQQPSWQQPAIGYFCVPSLKWYPEATTCTGGWKRVVRDGQ